MARCLNPRGAHDNPDGAVSCRRCDFLVHGALVGTGKYEVLSFIGAGSFGYVYKVREPMPLSRIMALKVLRLDQFNDKAKASFFQEARRIAMMQHPNILPVYNFGELESEQPYIVMEYAPQTISDLFRKSDGTMRLAFAEELLPYVQQAASALNYVHDVGMIHQDVKPGNILIGRNGQVLLSDFGTTLYLGTQTHASLGEVTGTAVYMPLEQWQGNPRRDSDQYALAICCYELLAGRPPFMYKRMEEMWHAHLHETPPSPQQWNPRIPVEVATVLLRAISKDYHHRYHSITEFAQSYTDAVQLAQQRYICHYCGQQNRTGAQRCAYCGADQDNRTCAHCDAPMRFGQRCCSVCGRLAIVPTMITAHPLTGVSVRQGRYLVKRVLKQAEDTRTTTSIAYDIQGAQKLVVLKRWECSEGPLANRAKDVAYYERVTAPLARLNHPLIPRVLDRFVEGKHYYLAMNYIQGESIEERLYKLLRPLPEHDVFLYMNSILNILLFLEQQQPPIRHYDISPANFLLDAARNRVHLVGFQIPPAPDLTVFNSRGKMSTIHRTTRKLHISPYLPIQDKPYDQRTCIYLLAATMHHALTNIAPPHYPTYPPIRQLNPTISAQMEVILARALQEDAASRYQSYQEMKTDIQPFL